MPVKRLFAALALCLCLAQPTTADSNLLSWIDFPSNGSTLSQGSVVLAGWTFDQRTGQMPEVAFVGLQNLDTGYRYNPSFVVVKGFYRPDVKAAFAGRITDYSTGYLIFINQQPTVGHWRIWVCWAAMDGSQDSRYTDVYIN